MPGTYISQPILLLNGAEAPPELIEDILQISIEESLHLPGMFTLVINNELFPSRSFELRWDQTDYFAIGMPIEIGFTSSTTEALEFSISGSETILQGEVTSIETHFTGTSQAPLIVRGYDLSHRLHRGRYNRSFQNMTDSDIVNQIITEVGLQAGTIDPSGEPHLYVFQENQTNMEFLRERAARLGFELFVQDGLLNFRRPLAGEIVPLKWLTNLNSLRVRVTSAEQVNAVEVRAWDYSLKQTIVSTATGATGVATTTWEPVITSPAPTQLLPATTPTTGPLSATSLNASSSTQPGTPTKTAITEAAAPAGSLTPKMIVVDRPVFNSLQSESIATAVYNELGGQYIYADGIADGNPYIRVGRVVNLLEMGKYTGQYYVTETRHLYYQRIYTTEFSVRGLQGANLMDTLSPKTRLQPGQTMLVGIVTNNQDPLGLGRVRVKFPTLTNEHESNWARMVQIGAGLNRGFDCLPEIGDEVLVGFEHGDIHRPYIIGGVWNGLDKPPVSFATAPAVVDSFLPGLVNSVMTTGPTMGTVRLRTLKTRVGHQLNFIEEDNILSFPTLKGIQLRTAGPLATGPIPVSGGGGSQGAAPDATSAAAAGAATKICSLEMSDSVMNPGIAAITGEGQGLIMSDLALPFPSTKLTSVGNISIIGGALPALTLDTPPGSSQLPAKALGLAASVLTGGVVNPLTKIDMAAGSINIEGVAFPPTNSITLSVGSSSITINALGIVIQAPMIHLNPPFNPFSLLEKAGKAADIGLTAASYAVNIPT